MKCGLLGRRLGHSYSPQIHSCLGDYPYALYEKEPEEIEDFLKHGDFSGINVTMPYKKEVIPYLDELSPRASRLGSVNTIVRRNDGTLIGHNTDQFGFQTMVYRSGLQVRGKKVLVLGSGGASRPVIAVLEDLGANVVVISRSGENNYNNLHLHADAAVIVNTTPVGMYPNTGESPIDLSRFPRLEGVLDIIFNPARTQLVMDAERRGLVAMNGLLMLVAQAKESAEWFTGHRIDDSSIELIHRQLRKQMENIILVGMPGCGKSTIGQLLAEKLGKQFVDADVRIAELAGKSIPDIFAQDGEEVFRTFETQVLSEIGKKSGQVISTGGGCVTRERNYPLLHQNGTIFWIQRDLELLPTAGRPLSQQNQLAELYTLREPMYRRFSDFTVSNTSTPAEVCSRITQIMEESL